MLVLNLNPRIVPLVDAAYYDTKSSLKNTMTHHTQSWPRVNKMLLFEIGATSFVVTGLGRRSFLVLLD